MITTIFLRHGPTQENVDQRIQGHQHGTLLVRETEQYVAAATPLLRRYNPTLLLSSDLQRAVQTRIILKQFLQIPDIKEAALWLLRERNMGENEGKLWSDLPPPIQQLRGQKEYDFRPYKGEASNDVSGRVSEALQYIAKHYSTDVICCITHSGWLQQLVQLSSSNLPPAWIQRTALYEGKLDENGALLELKLVPIAAKLPGN